MNLDSEMWKMENLCSVEAFKGGWENLSEPRK